MGFFKMASTKKAHGARNSELGRGVMKYSRGAMYHRRGRWGLKKPQKGAKAFKPTAKVVEKKIGGDKNGSVRVVPVQRQPRFLDTQENLRKPKKTRPFAKHVRKFRASLAPGAVVILLAGRHQGKRAVVLGQLASGLLCVS